MGESQAWARRKDPIADRPYKPGDVLEPHTNSGVVWVVEAVEQDESGAFRYVCRVECGTQRGTQVFQTGSGRDLGKVR